MLPFLDQQLPRKWQSLSCLCCEEAAIFDKALSECLDEVAVCTSLLLIKTMLEQEQLWYQVGLILIEAGSSRAILPESFVRGT